MRYARCKPTAHGSQGGLERGSAPTLATGNVSFSYALSTPLSPSTDPPEAGIRERVVPRPLGSGRVALAAANRRFSEVEQSAPLRGRPHR